MFVWAPHKLFGGTTVCCPTCMKPATGETRWGRTQVLHMKDEEAVFIASRHSCLRCRADHHEGGVGRNRCYSFCAGSPDVVDVMPDWVKAAWPLTHFGGRMLCDSALVCTVRAWATRTRWTAIAGVLNELRATKHAQLARSYRVLCDALQVQPVDTCDGYKSLTARWVNDIYERDYKERAPDIAAELLAEIPGEILAVDWTRDAAARCAGHWMFNALDSNGIILNSILTTTTSPNEIAPVLRQLRSRGLQPKAIYVDEECCGAWKGIVADIWPGAAVVLDAFHAIRRLTQTTASTRHPWHKHFCRLISDSVFGDDAELSLRFRKACERGKVQPKIARRLKREYVARHVRNKAAIETSIDEALAEYTARQHAQCGPLLTAKTFAAWGCLKAHVRNGCICDPNGVDVNVLGEKSVTIGGQQFKKVKVARGSSALEGFHAHQKSWLGSQVHSCKRGLALVADGTARFNRRRRNSNSDQLPGTPPVFSPGLLAATHPRHKTFIEDGARRLLACSAVKVATPVRSISDNEVYDVHTLMSKHQCDNEVPHESRSLSGNMACTEKSDPIWSPKGKTCKEPKPCGDVAVRAKGRKKSTSHTTDMPTPVRSLSSNMKPPTISTPKPATSPQSGCRICRMVGTQCRKYRDIQWCETRDVPFDDWVAGPFKLKKAESLAKAKRSAARIGGLRGRPTKKTSMPMDLPQPQIAAMESALPAPKVDTATPGMLQSDATRVPRQTKCRNCKFVGRQCRRLSGIQWCEARDPPFDNWRTDIYPGLKASALKAASKRAARAIGVRGRPPKRR